MMATPTIQRNVGNTTSVMVQPFQAECCSGPYALWPSPALFTRTMRAIVAPGIASSATNLDPVGVCPLTAVSDRTGRLLATCMTAPFGRGSACPDPPQQPDRQVSHDSYRRNQDN